MSAKKTFPRTQNTLLTIQILGDTVFAALGLLVGYAIRFRTPLREFGVESADVSLKSYAPLLLIGTILFIATYAYLKVYDARLLLRPHRAFTLFAKGTFFWFCLFLGLSLALKFEPSISRLFVTVSCLTTLSVILLWRTAFNVWISRSELRERIIQRILIVGWNPEAEKLVEAVNVDRNHPYKVIGYLNTQLTTQDTGGGRICRRLGGVNELSGILKAELIDMVIVADFNLGAEELLKTATTCERLYVQFKITPSFFRIFVSSLRLQTISGVPVLGVEDLQISALPNALLKRFVDILGSLVGLVLTAPIMIVLAVIIYRESPGHIIYRQTRTGRHGKPFTIYKMRSMKLDAETQGAQWAVEGDSRRLKIGKVMREKNLDELPQFWNVLVGDMSLVGPRPERPELISKFELEIPHYNPRHEVRPGITGWAQVNGLRGNTSLVDRIKYDLYYIENWSLWFDCQILLLTFLRQKNAY